MSAENNVPAIRFKGFSGMWGEYSFSDISDSFEYGLNAAATKYDGENKYIRITDVNEDTRAFDLGAITSPNADLSKADNYRLQLGDILFARTGASVGKTYIYKKHDGVVYFAGFLIRARVKKEVNTEFVFQSTLTEKYNKFIRLTSQRSGQPGVNALEYGSYKIFLAPPKEQIKIGNYFQQLDTLIAQHQQKHDKLLNLKKALLEKTFPKQGATVPDIRFKGFSGEWEEKELGSDVAEIVGGGTPSTNMSEYWDGDIDWYSPTEIGKKVYADGSIKKITPLGLVKSSARVLPSNKTVLFTSRAGIGDVAILKRDGSTNQGFQSLIMKDGFDAYFVFSASHLIKQYALKHASGSTFLEISGKLLGKMGIYIPCSTEQTKIGNLFKQIDILITQHQTQMIKLNNIKQACLSKMFV